MKIYNFVPNKIKHMLYSLKTNPETGYNMTISDEDKYVWFRIAKVGTNSIERTLENNTKFSINASWMEFDEDKYKDYFKFAFVRNPWGRLVSCYSNKVLTKKLFRECWNKDFKYFVNFIKKEDLRSSDRHIRPQSFLFPVDKVDFIGHFENLEADFYIVCDKLNIPRIKLPSKNISNHKHYIEYYGDETRQIVAEEYAKDIEYFGYKFGE